MEESVITFVSHCADHPVLLGNHRDAYTFGGNDPNSGTAALMEVVRAVGVLRASGECEGVGVRARGVSVRGVRVWGERV